MNCGICMAPIAPDEAAKRCPSCTAFYHADCWEEIGGCAVYGCNMVPVTERIKPLEIPPAFWGCEYKDCPNCGKQIMAMAGRCRYCGAQVEAIIETREDFQERLENRAHSPRLRKLSLLFLVMSLLPVLSLIPTVFGTLFYRKNREEIRKLPGSYDGYYRISIAAGAAQTAVIVLALAVWWVKYLILAR